MDNVVIGALLHHAERTPNKLAIIGMDERASYGEMARLVRGFATVLKERGFRKGDCVIFQSEQTLAFAVAQMAVHLAGGIFTPVERSITRERMAEIVDETDARIVISKRGDDLKYCVNAEENIACSEVLELARGVTEYCDFELPVPDDPAEMLFTTGTTGKSKGVLCSHRSVAAVAQNLICGMSYEQDTLLLVPGQLSHANAIRKLTAAYLFGSAVMLLDGVTNLSAFFSALDSEPVTALCLPPAAVRVILMLSGDKLGKYQGRIKFVESASSVMPESDKQHLCELLPFTRLYNAYGTSEAGSSCMYDYNQDKGLEGCIGKPSVNAHFLIVDDDGNEIESSKANPGLIRYGGTMCMMGYWRAPELTARTLKDGMIQTSDLGYIDENGWVYVLGRRDDVINVGGNKVAPDEVEQAALTIEGIGECGCARVEDKISGESVMLAVVMKDGFEFDMAGIRAELRDKLEDYKVPKVIRCVMGLPRSSNGKLNRNEMTRSYSNV